MLQLPLVQQQLVDSFARRLSQKTGITIHPGRVYVGLFRPLLMQDFLLQSTQGDTLLHLGRMEVAIQPFALFRQEVQIPELVLKDSQLSLVRAAADSTFNFQPLLDAFSSDRPREETPPTLGLGTADGGETEQSAGSSGQHRTRVATARATSQTSCPLEPLSHHDLGTPLPVAGSATIYAQPSVAHFTAQTCG